MRLSHIAPMLRSHGLTVVEEPGWSTRGYNGQDLSDLRGVLWHHTATASARHYTSGLPTRNVLINGHSLDKPWALPGPLCQIGLARDGVVHLIAAGLANHAGEGEWPGIPKNTGNWHLVGVEMESSGVAPADWTPDQLRVAPYLGAALARCLWGNAEHWQIAHYEYAGPAQGKIDPALWPGGMDGLRASINARIAEFDVPTVVTPASTDTPAPAPTPAPVKTMLDMIKEMTVADFTQALKTALEDKDVQFLLGRAVADAFNRPDTKDRVRDIVWNAPMKIEGELAPQKGKMSKPITKLAYKDHEDERQTAVIVKAIHDALAGQKPVGEQKVEGTA